MDDAYRGGKRGCGAAGKTPLFAAMQTNDDGHPIAMSLTKLKGFRKAALAAWAQRQLPAATIVVSDSLSCFACVAIAGYKHEAIVTGGGPASVANEAFTWVDAMIGYVKNSIHGTYHGISSQHALHFLAEFCYRFNRRFALAALIPRLGYIATYACDDSRGAGPAGSAVASQVKRT